MILVTYHTFCTSALKHSIDQLKINMLQKNNMANQQQLIDSLTQHVGLTPKNEDPSNKMFVNQEKGFHTHFLETGLHTSKITIHGTDFQRSTSKNLMA